MPPHPNHPEHHTPQRTDVCDRLGPRRPRRLGVDGTGRQAQRFTVEHSAVGLRGLLRRLDELGVGEVAIERRDGPVVDQLLEAGLTVVVISPNQLKNLRGRNGERPLGIITGWRTASASCPKPAPRSRTGYADSPAKPTAPKPNSTSRSRTPTPSPPPEPTAPNSPLTSPNGELGTMNRTGSSRDADP